MHVTAQGPRLRNDLCCVEWDVKLYSIPTRVRCRCSTAVADDGYSNRLIVKPRAPDNSAIQSFC